MSSVIVSSKFQVVIPREVREAHGIKPGDRMKWFDSGGSLRLVRVVDMDQTAGILAGRSLSPFEREKDR